jgi:hypothetical protein
MRIGPYTLRKPWVKMVDVPFEETVYKEVRSSMVDDIIAEIKADNEYAVNLLNTYRDKY